MAAGASSRMRGRDKMLEPVAGQPLIRDRALMCLASKADAVRVVVSPEFPDRKSALDGLAVDIVTTKGADLGLSHSLQTGAHGVSGDLMIVLADLPDLTTADLDRIIDAAADHPHAEIVRGTTANGKAGHPVLLTAAASDMIGTLSGDQGLQAVLEGRQPSPHLVEIGGNRAQADLDTPEDWRRWRQANSD